MSEYTLEQVIQSFVEYHETNKNVRLDRIVLPPSLARFRDAISGYGVGHAVNVVLTWLNACFNNNEPYEVWSAESERLELVRQLLRLLPQLTAMIRIVDTVSDRQASPRAGSIAVFSIRPDFPPEQRDWVQRYLKASYHPDVEGNFTRRFEGKR